MKLSSSKLVVIIGSALIGTFSILLYLDITRSVTGTGEPIGTITFKRKNAQRKFARQEVWREIENNAPIYANDTIRTEDLSEASLTIQKTTVIKLNESSMIVVNVKGDDLSINFARGSIKAEKSGAGGKVSINAGGVNVSMKNGRIDLDGSGGQDLSLTVSGGSAVVKSATGEKTVGENQQVTTTGDEVRVFDLAIRLATPAHDAVLSSPNQKQKVAFAWELSQEGLESTLLVSRNYSFSNSLTVPVKGKARELELDNGIYYWKVMAKNPANGKIESSKVQRLTLYNDPPLRLLSPANGAIAGYRNKTPLVNFRWTGSDVASSYAIMVARDANFTDPVVNQQIQTTGIAIDTLGDGTWFWRVEKIIPSYVTTARGTERSETWSMTVRKTEKSAPPEPLFPMGRKNFTTMAVKNRGVMFSWKSGSEILSSAIEIARDRNFQERITAQDVTAPYFKFTGELTPGLYYWRVTGNLADGSRTDPSPAAEFTVKDITAIELLLPADNDILVLKEPGLMATPRFSWKSPGIPGTFTLTLAADNAFNAVVKTGTTSDLSLALQDVPPGSYFWRVTFAGENESVASAPRSLSIREALTPPVITLPVTGTVDMLGKQSLQLLWQPPAGSTHTRISLFKVMPGGAQNIGVYEIQGNTLNFTEMKKLQLGEFYITARAIERFNGRLIRESGDAISRFTIILGQKDLPKPEIKIPDVIYIEQ